jgi:Na+-driven multidrug efflux pump
MYLISAFQQSLDVELAVTELEQLGIGKERILAVPLDQLMGGRPLLDTIHRSDGISLFDLGSVLGTVCAVLGASFGFVWVWGPVIWGLIGFGAGFVAGFALDVLINRHYLKKKRVKRPAAELILMVRCLSGEQSSVRQVLERHFALGVGKVERP